MKAMIQLLCRRGSVRTLLLLLLLALTGSTLFTLAALRPRNDEPLDRAAYDLLMASRVREWDDLLDWFYDQQDQMARIIPPGLEELIQPGTPDLLVLDSEALQKELASSKPAWRNSVPVWELELQENLGGEITIRDGAGNQIHTFPAPPDYQFPYEALFRQSLNAYTPELNRYKLRSRISLLPQEFVEPYLYVQAEIEAYARQQAVPAMQMMSGGGDELAISGMQRVTNGLRLTVSYPASFSGQVWSVYQQNTPACISTNMSGGSGGGTPPPPDGTNGVPCTNCVSCMVDLTNSFNGLESIWALCFNNMILTGETSTSWTDTQPMGSDTNGNPVHRFYGVGSNEDPDNDELQSGYELFIAHTDAQNADTDGDSLLDGWERSYGFSATDATGDNGSYGDPDGDGLSNSEEQSLGSNPIEGNTITVLSPSQVTLQFRSVQATREKCGWEEFTHSNEPPVIYRRITQVASETDQWIGPETICATSGVLNASVLYQATTYTNCNPDTGVQSNVYVGGNLISTYEVTHPPCPVWWVNENITLLTSGMWTGTINGFGPPYPGAYCPDPSGCSTGVSYSYSQRFVITNGVESITPTQWSVTEDVVHETPDQGTRVRNMTYTLSELYTTEDLAARVRTAVSSCAVWEEINWGNSRWVQGLDCVSQTGAASSAWYDLSQDERTAQARALQYKISFGTVADQVYEVSWLEVFKGATTNVLQNRRVRKMGTGGVIELPIETIDPPAEEGIVYPVVLKVEIEKCSSSFEPMGGSEDNTTTIRAFVTPNTLTGKFKFTLTDVSSEPGYCMNAPKPAPGSGEDSDAWKDLQFPDQTGFTISGSDWDVAETAASDVSEATVTVKSFDYASFGRIKAEFIVNGTGPSCVGRESGGSREFTAIPRDDNDNQIADSWQYELSGGSGASDDGDIPGAGAHEQAGDGLSRYEEYRGFMIKGVHTRTVPILKDVFLYDEDSLGYGFLGAGVVTVHLIDPDEFNGTSSRIVNFNRGHASVVAQHGLWMIDLYLGYGTFGWAPADATPGGQTEAIRISLDSFDEVFTNGWPVYLVDETIAHELGHGIDIDHHSPEWGGVSSCVMRYRSPQETEDGQNGNWNLVPQRTSYCIPQDDCYGQIDVSDPN